MLFRSPYGLKAQHIIIQVTTNSPCNLHWEKAKLACLDQKTSIQPQTVNDLQFWSEGEAEITRRLMGNRAEPPNMFLKGGESSTKSNTGVRKR